MFDYLKTVSIIFCFSLIAIFAQGQLVINELSADNKTNFTDEFGENPDWIELYNNNNFSIDLYGFYLSDDEDNLNKWTFPNITIGPNEYLIVVTDGKNLESTYVHTNFKLSKDGESVFLTDTDLQIIDSIKFPPLPSDLSFGRTDLEWVIMNATPGLQNNTVGLQKLDAPVWSKSSGFFSESISLELTSPQNATIKYSINNKPDTKAFDDFLEEITLDVTSNICAYTEKDGFLNSETVCQTFFINTTHNIPVISISGNDFDFFDSTEGLFSLGPNAEPAWPFWGANFWEDTELEVHIEYFENEKSQFLQTAGLKMHGGRESRTSAMKSMRFLAKEKYGKPTFDYPVFNQKPNINSYKKLVLRNASGDYNEGHIRDGFLQSHLKSNKLNIDLNAYQAVAVYINGEYYGFMGLREKTDEQYIKSNYSLTEDRFDLLENDSLVINGNRDAFIEDYNFTQLNDLSIKANYETVKQLFDIESLVDYFIAEISTNNTAWPNNNIRYWKSYDDNSRWRYVLFDMDIALGRHAWTEAHVNVFENKFEGLGNTNPHLNIFYSLMKNSEFKNYFFNRHQDIANTVFEFNYFLEELENHVDTIRDDILQHFEKWDPQKGMIWENEKIEIIRFYISQRPDYSKKHLIDAFELDGSYALDIEVTNENGFVNLNTLDSLQNFHGYYVQNVPIELSALENKDTKFSYWEITTGNNQMIIYDKTTSISLTKDTRLKAFFNDSDKKENTLVVNYSEVNKTLQIKISDDENLENLYLRIFDTTGKLMESKTISLNKNVWKSIDLDLNTSGTYFLSISNEEKIYSNKFIFNNEF